MIFNHAAFSQQIKEDTSINEFEEACLNLTAEIYIMYQLEYPNKDIPWIVATEEMAIERGIRQYN